MPVLQVVHHKTLQEYFLSSKAMHVRILQPMHHTLIAKVANVLQEYQLQIQLNDFVCFLSKIDKHIIIRRMSALLYLG